MTIDYLDRIVMPEERYYLLPYHVDTLKKYFEYRNKYHNLLYSDYNRIVIHHPMQIGWEVNG